MLLSEKEAINSSVLNLYLSMTVIHVWGLITTSCIVSCTFVPWLHLLRLYELFDLLWWFWICRDLCKCWIVNIFKFIYFFALSTCYYWSKNCWVFYWVKEVYGKQKLLNANSRCGSWFSCIWKIQQNCIQIL